MNELKSENVAVNLSLFKLFGVHRILDLNRSRSVFNVFDCKCNIYGLAVIAIASISLVICLVTFFNMFVEIHNDVIQNLELMQILLLYVFVILEVLIAYTFVFNAKNVWNLLDVARIDFLSSRICRKYVCVLWKYRNNSIVITNSFVVCVNVVITIWIMYPFVVTSVSSDAADHRKENIFNLHYPVTSRVYNDYYPMFYMMEMFITIQGVYIFSFFNIYFLSFCCVFIAQYEVIALAYEDIGYDSGSTDPMQIDLGKVSTKNRYHINNIISYLLLYFNIS